jgi:hypothetical protein
MRRKQSAVLHAHRNRFIVFTSILIGGIGRVEHVKRNRKKGGNLEIPTRKWRKHITHCNLTHIISRDSFH